MPTARLPMIAILLACLSIPASAQWTGGPVLISGLDPEDRPFQIGQTGTAFPPDPDRSDNWLGWEYIRQGFNFVGIRGRSGKPKLAVCLGCELDTAEAFTRGFDASLLPRLGWNRAIVNTADGITDFLEDCYPCSPALADAGLLYIPTTDESLVLTHGGLTPAESDALKDHAAIIRKFVKPPMPSDPRGGLFAHNQFMNTNRWQWLSDADGLLPNLGVSADINYLDWSFTSSGKLALPASVRKVIDYKDIGSANTATGGVIEVYQPWHSDFTNFGDLTAFAQDDDPMTPRVLMIGAPDPSAPCNTNAVYPEFAGPSLFSVGDEPRAVAIADFDGQDGPDIVVANHGVPFSTQGSVFVLLNNGVSGTWQGFASAQTFSAGDNPIAATTGDFDADNGPDIAIVNLESDNVSVFINNGNASFSSAGSPIGVGNQPTSIVATDIDNDGDIDLIISNSEDNDISVLKNKGGTGASWNGFDAKQDFAPDQFQNNRPKALVAANFIPGDGPDLAVANENGNDVSPVKNQGGSGASWMGLTFLDDFGTTSTPTSLTGADFDGDGIFDLGISGYETFNGIDQQYESSIRIHIGIGNGTFESSVRQGPDDFLAGTWVGSMSFNGDSAPDLVAVKTFSSGDISASFVTLLANNPPKSEFPWVGALEAGTNSVSGAVSDLDGDTLDDLIVVDQDEDKIRVFLRSNATMSPDCNNNGVPDECDISDGLSIDFDNDGVPDECQGPDSDGDGIIDILDLPCPCDYNPPHEGTFDCDGNGTIGGTGTGEAAGEQCNFCACDTPATSCLTTP